MPTIPHVATALQHVLTTEADRAGRQTRFVQRADAKLTGSAFVQTLVFGLGSNPHASLSALTQTSAALGVPISPEALHQRFTRAAATCLEQVLSAALRQVVVADPLVLPILDRFPAVVVQDSTSIALPEAFAAVWHGCGNGTPHAGNATLKLQLSVDLCRGQLRGPTLHDGREPDPIGSIDADLPVGAVRIVDLGFWDLAHLADLQHRGIYWLSRMQLQTAIQTEDGRWWTVAEWVAADAAPCRDVVVRVGRTLQVPARVVAVRVPQEVADQRRRRLRARAQGKGETVSARRLALADWTILLTTIPPDQASPTELVCLARARWQIELLIKLWKSHGQIDEVRKVRPWRVLCELYGRLLNQIVQHWLLLVSGWDEPARSWVKAAQTIRMHWLVILRALPERTHLLQVLTDLAACIRAGCRKQRRHQHPSTFQLFFAAATADEGYA
jgi:Transposase DDE domain